MCTSWYINPKTKNMFYENKHRLTAREQEVYQLLCKGYQDREIGELLKLSVETVKKHNKSVYLKLGVRNRTEAVVLNALQTPKTDTS